MADRNDEMIALRNHISQKATEAAVNQIAKEVEANASNFWELSAQGRFDDAGYHLRQAWALDEEARKIAAAAQPEQQQSQYTEAELSLIRDYPAIINDPQKWATALAAARNLQLMGHSRDSAAYISGIAHAVGILDSNLTESSEVASPNEALRASQSKYGEVTASEYNENAKRLAELKKYGLYPMSQ
jgi:hypothetical protein